MTHAKIGLFLGGVSALALAGCASVPRRAGFGEIRQAVEMRSGQRIAWRGDSQTDAAIHRAVATMLQRDLSVNDAVEIALLNNLDLQASYEDLGIAQSDLVQAGLLQNPTLSLERRFSGQAAEIDVAQDFLDLLALPMRKKIAAADLEAVKARLAHEVLQLAADVKSAYYTYQAREQLIDRLKVVSDLNHVAAELATRQHEAGTLNELGADDQQAVYEQSLAEATQAQAQLAADRERLNRLMGFWGNQIAWKVPPKLPDLPSAEPSLDRLEEKALTQRMDLGARRQEIISAARKLGIANAFRYVPGITVSAHYEHDIGPEHSIGPAVEFGLPLFDQGQTAVARGSAVLTQARRRYLALAIEIRSQVREARQRMLAQRQLAGQYKALLHQRMRILQLTLEQYNGMLMGPYDLLLARQNEVQTEKQYIEAWRDYWIERTELERSIGGRVPGAPRPVSESLPATVPTSPTRPLTTTPATSQESMPGMNMHDMHMHGMNMPGM